MVKENKMARAVTLFTGQWADLTLETIAQKAAEWGYDGLELACWGDHFEVDKALADDKYCENRLKILKKRASQAPLIPLQELSNPHREG